MVFIHKDNIIPKIELLELIDKAGAVILIDKPFGWTSFDVIAKIRNILQQKKIGHSGTLDPLATGLLIICVGRKATKKIEIFQNLEKYYEAIIKFGYNTETYDAEGKEIFISETKDLTIKKIENILNNFIGEIEQIPPKFSAKKINGQSAYKLARKHKNFELKPQIVNIKDIKIKHFENPFLKINVICSKGTYIRSLAYEIGKKLGYGGYLTDLRRNAIGEYNVDKALTIEEFIKYYSD